jgi:hypothetical protein
VFCTFSNKKWRNRCRNVVLLCVYRKVNLRNQIGDCFQLLDELTFKIFIIWVIQGKGKVISVLNYVIKYYGMKACGVIRRLRVHITSGSPMWDVIVHIDNHLLNWCIDIYFSCTEYTDELEELKIAG